MDEIIDFLKRNVRYHRKQLKLSQQELAEKSDLSTSFIQEIELGRKQPSFKTLYKLSDALNIEIHQLLMNPDINDSQLIKDFSVKLKDKLNQDIEDLINRY